MSAKEMFNALGYYEKDVGYTNILCYEKDVNVPNVPHYIGLQFVLNHEYISIYNHVGGRYEYGKECHYSYGAFNGFDVELLRAIEQQMKELGWLEEEKREIKQETNFEHYKDRILDCCIDNLAVVKGIPKSCSKIDCNDCDFLTIQKECCKIAKDWLKQPYKKFTYKLNKFEFDLIQTYSDCHESCKFSEFNQLIELKNKGYFKNIDEDATIEDILAKCEVVG